MFYSDRVPFLKRKREIINEHLEDMSEYLYETLLKLCTEYKIEIKYLKLIVKDTINEQFKKDVKNYMLENKDVNKIDIFMLFKSCINAYNIIFNKMIEQI